MFLFVNALGLVKINNLVTGNSGGAAEDVHKETENKPLLPAGEDATQQMAFPGYQDCQCTCVKRLKCVCVGVGVSVCVRVLTYLHLVSVKYHSSALKQNPTLRSFNKGKFDGF